MPTPIELAKAFCEELRGTLTPEQMDEVNEKNAQAKAGGICHSHDFCDANQVMLDALAKFGLDFDHASVALINEAWQLAKDAEYSAEEIDRQERGFNSRT